eukprot:4757080-Prymnesium_polylepis.1
MADDAFAELTASLRVPTGRQSQFRPASEPSAEMNVSSEAGAALEMLQSAETSVAQTEVVYTAPPPERL